MRSDARKNEDKFSSNWEGPFRIREVAAGGTYHLEWLLEKSSYPANTAKPQIALEEALTGTPY